VRVEVQGLDFGEGRSRTEGRVRDPKPNDYKPLPGISSWSNKVSGFGNGISAGAHTVSGASRF